MPTIQGKGVVLKVQDIGECNKRITILLKEHGKITATARGSKKHTSKMMAGTQMFSYSDFVLYEGSGFYSVSQADLIENFYDLCSDYDTLLVGNYICEICDKSILQDEECDDILQLLIKTLWKMAKKKTTAVIGKLVFEYKFLFLSGHAPQLDSCVTCGNYDTLFNFIDENGVICRDCIKYSPNKRRISSSTLEGINYIINSDLNVAYSFLISEIVQKEMEDVAIMLIKKNLDVRLVSLEMM